jgi:hypothetical protein
MLQLYFYIATISLSVIDFQSWKELLLLLFFSFVRPTGRQTNGMYPLFHIAKGLICFCVYYDYNIVITFGQGRKGTIKAQCSIFFILSGKGILGFRR